MKPTNKNAALALACLVMLNFSACAHVRGKVRPPTPFEQVLATNAALANANQLVAEAVIGAQQQKLISVELASKILGEVDTLALLDKEVTKILRQGPEAAKGNAAALDLFLNQIRLTARELVKSGALGIKNTNTQKSVAAEVEALYNLVDALLDGLKAAGVLAPAPSGAGRERK